MLGRPVVIELLATLLRDRLVPRRRGGRIPVIVFALAEGRGGGRLRVVLRLPGDLVALRHSRIVPRPHKSPSTGNPASPDGRLTSKPGRAPRSRRESERRPPMLRRLSFLCALALAFLIALPAAAFAC